MTHPPTLVWLPRKWPHIRGRLYWQKRYRLNLAMTQIKKRQYSILTWNEHLFCWVLAGTKYWLYLSWVCFLWKLHYTFWRNKRVFCDKDLMFLNLSWGKVFHLQKYLPEIFSALQNIFSEISFAKCVFSAKDLREVSAEGEIAQTTCLVRVWISFLWECGFHYIKTAHVKLLNGEHLNGEMWKRKPSLNMINSQNSW